MLVKVKYSGFYSLGSDYEIKGIKIMRSKWNIYKRPVIVYGRKNIVSPFLQYLYYVISDNDVAFFVAIEYGLGHYHVFSVNNKINKKLSKNLSKLQPYNPMAVHINKSGHGVHIYGRVASGAKDLNFKVDDSFFKLISQEIHDEYRRYIFTNNGEDRFYLDVYQPQMIDESELFVMIGKAEKIIWQWDSAENGSIFQEYRLLDAYVELTRVQANEKEIFYFH